MERVSGLRYSHFNARNVLRERFQRLPRIKVPERTFREVEQKFPSDVDVLKLLCDTTLSKNNLPSNAVQKYSRLHSESVNQLPDYQEALARGWFRQSWSGVVRAWPLGDYVRYTNPPFGQELREFMHQLYDATYQVANPGSHGTASELETHLLDLQGSGERPPILSSKWIAARLWDSPPTRDLAEWEMRWTFLSRPPVLPALAWSVEHAQEFREAVLDAVRQGNLPGWGGGDYANAIQTTGDIRNATSVTDLPSHLLGLHLHHPASHMDGRQVYETEELTTLIGLLVLELPHIEAGPVPSATAEALVDLALLYPEVLEALIVYLRQAPEALADFVLCPRATVLVSYLTATWDFQVPWERDHRDSAGEAVQISLFEDCLAVLRHFLVQENVTPEEYAHLLIALQEHDASRGGLLQKLPFGIEHLQDLPTAVCPQVRSSLVHSGGANANSPAFASMLKAIAVVGTDLLEPEATQVSQAYKAAIGSPDHQPDVSLLDTAAAGALVQVALGHSGTARNDVLHPLDVQAELASGRRAGGFSIGMALRAHIRVLSRAIAGYPESVPDELIAALVDAIHSGARDRANRQQVDAFTFELEPWRKQRQRPVEVDLAAAITRLENPAQQTRIVNALLEVEEPLVLAVLLQRLPRIYHDSIRQRLEQLTPAQASPAHWVQQLEHRVAAFLDLGLPHLAEMYLEERQRLLQGRTSADLAVTGLRAELQLHYLRGELSAILGTAIPSGLPREYEQEARRAIDFFRALVLMKQAPPDFVQGAAIFLRLYNEQPNASYAINLLAARMGKLLENNTFETLEGQAATQAKEALRHADTAIPNRADLSPEARAVHNPNCAAMLLAIGQPQKALRRLEELEPAARTAESMAFEAVANARVGDHERATSLIRSAKDRFGSIGVVTGAENHLAHSMPHAGSVRVLTHEESATRIRAALQQFSELSPERQAAVLVDGAMPLEQVVTELFRDSLAAFQRVISFLKLSQNEFHEDDFNGLLAEIVQGRVDTVFGWQPHEQSPGGFTAAGNAGRRDLVLRRRGVDIAVFEALKSEQPNDHRIAEHFHKLFGYSTTNLFLHVTYSRRQQVLEMVNAVRKVAEQPPSGTTYLGQREIPAEGARPSGIRGAYRRGGEDVTVLFFVVDMLQEAQRQAVGAPQVL